MTLDGKIASKTGDSFWITSDESRQLAQEFRAEAGAVLVGSGTVLKDDPSLNYRGEKQLLQPKRIILDLQNRIPQSAKIFQSAGGAVIHVKLAQHRQTCFSFDNAGIRTQKSSDPISALKSKNPTGWDKQADLFTHKILREYTPEQSEVSEILVNNAMLADNGEFLLNLMKYLFAEFGIQGVLVEGGSATLTSFFEANLVDEVNIFIAPKLIGGAKAKTAFEGAGIEKMQNAINLKNAKFQPLKNNEILIQALLTNPTIPML